MLEKRVEGLMRQARVAGIHRRQRHGRTRRDLAAEPADDLVNRAFDPEDPNRLWVWTSPSTHALDSSSRCNTSRRWVRCRVRNIHQDAEGSLLRLDRSGRHREGGGGGVRRPPKGQTVAHSDHGSTYASWAFGRRLRSAGLLGSMGTVGDCFDNSVAESFFGTLQLELLDEHHWTSRQHLALAIFDWIEAWYNPKRRHSYCNMLSPVDYEATYAA